MFFSDETNKNQYSQTIKKVRTYDVVRRGPPLSGAAGISHGDIGQPRRYLRSFGATGPITVGGRCTMSTVQKVAVITGASRGIGAALVKAYRDRGYHVVATARSIQPSTDDAIVTVPGDAGDRSTAERVVAESVGRFGRVDTLINNAGIFIPKPFAQHTNADYAAILGVNLAGFFNMTQLAIAEMEKQGSGHVVQITTSLVNHANSAVPSVLASLTKGGLDAATRSLAIEYAKRGVRVNAVAPGVIRTPMHSPAAFAQFDAQHPVGHMGEISDIVDAVLCLESAGFVTGEILHVDGGQSSGH